MDQATPSPATPYSLLDCVDQATPSLDWMDEATPSPTPADCISQASPCPLLNWMK